MPVAQFVSSQSPPAASRPFKRASVAESLSVLNQRLANAERELRTQFIRIAQLQAQLDSLPGALRGSPDKAHRR